MPRYAQLVMGPAGSGKSTFCSTMVSYCEAIRRTVHVVNLDPAAEQFSYPVLADLRDLISVEDAMEDEALKLGPNGGLIFCMEYLSQNFDWLHEAIDDIEDDYIIFDCPGQIELYTHIPVMRQLVEQLASWNFRVCGVYIMEAQFMMEVHKFISGMMSALSTMVNLEIPHVNVMSKLDLLNKSARKELDRYLEPDMHTLLAEEVDQGRIGKKFEKLNHSIANLIDDYSLVKFIPLDNTNEDSIGDVLVQIDSSIQYGEDLEPRERVEDGDFGETDGEDAKDIMDKFAQQLGD